MSPFPKRNKNNQTAEIGVNLVSTVFNDHFGWVFRRTHQEHDFGIDAYVDHVTAEGAVTGRSIACQIKTGASYITSTGHVHWYKDTKEHLNYFLNLQTPLLLVICDPETRQCFWAALNKDEVDFQENGWRHAVPKSQTLTVESLKNIEELFGGITDHLTDFEQDQQFLRTLSQLPEDAFIQYSVPREDVEGVNIGPLQSFIRRISRNEKLTLAAQGKLYICTYGYEADTREVFHIPAVRAWAAKARREIGEWYLCAHDSHYPSTLKWIASSTIKDIKAKLTRRRDGRLGYNISSDSRELSEFMGECFAGLNEASEKWGWPTKYNYEISKKISKELLPAFPFPRLEE